MPHEIAATVLGVLPAGWPVAHQTSWPVRDGGRGWSSSRSDIESVLRCREPGKWVCGDVLRGWSNGVSYHVAPYRARGFESSPLPLLLWADVDRFRPATSSACWPFWPSRFAAEPRRGVVVVPGPVPPCLPACAWRHLADHLDGDPSAAHGRHSFRLPGVSAVKNGPSEGDGGAWYEPYVSACETFLGSWNRWKSSGAPTPLREHDMKISSGNGAVDRAAAAMRPPPPVGRVTEEVYRLAREAWHPGARHVAAVGFAGALRRAGIPEEAAVEEMLRMCDEMGDPEVAERVRQVRATYRIPLDKVAGMSILFRVAKKEEL